MHLIRYLSCSDENRLTVIEKKQERCKEASTNSDATILNADGSKPDVLKLAEASQADIVIVTTNDPKNKERLREAGAAMAICPAELALKDLEHMLERDRAVTLMYRSELDLRVAETIIPLNATLIGKKIHEIQMPEKCRVALVCRDSSYVFPEPELELKSGDKVLLLGDAPSVARTVELLRSSETA